MGRFVAPVLLLFVLTSAGCGGPKDELSGIWVAQSSSGSESLDAPGDTFEFSLTFRDDGTFAGRMSTRIMMVMDAKLKGTYKRSGDEVVLTGTNEMYMDDGYRKDTSTVPFTLKLKVEKDRLIADSSKEVPVTTVFRRKGAAPLSPPPKPPLSASDANAVAIIKEVEKRYAALKTYADEGTFESDGAGFKARKGRFQIRHSRNGTFLYKAEHLANGKPYQTDAVWGNGKAYRLHLGDVGGSEERPLGNGLSILAVTSGNAATLIPSLLEPVKMKGSELDRLEALAVRDAESVDGKGCYVIKGAYGERETMQLWIDMESYLIRRVYDSIAKATVNFNPRINQNIPAGAFEFAGPR